MFVLYTATLSNGFWEYAISIATHVYNYTPICSLKGCTPYKAWNTGHVSDISYF